MFMYNQNKIVFEPLIKGKVHKNRNVYRVSEKVWVERLSGNIWKNTLENCETCWYNIYFFIYLLNIRQFISKTLTKNASLEIFFFITLYQFQWKNQMSDWCWFFLYKCSDMHLSICQYRCYMNITVNENWFSSPYLDLKYC